MDGTERNARGVTIAVFVLALLTSFGCSGGSDYGSGGGSNPAALACADGGLAAADSVVLTCGGPDDDTTERVDVVLGGTASGTTTLHGFSFDVSYDPSKLEFLPVSNPVSPLLPSALIAVSLANGQQGDVVVAIQQPGTLPSVQVPAGQNLVISLFFRRVSGATFGPTPLTFADAEATNPSSAVVFLNGLTLEYQ